ncbi:MAG: glycerophosphodiester phosphodiesterase [Acidimicrobiales bacterium]
MVEARRSPPLAFAHRGARLRAPENTLEAFTLAVELGATGLETDAWLTADGVAVLDHDGSVRAGLRRRPIARTDAADLPPTMPSISQLYEAVGCDLDLSVDVKDPAAAAHVVAAARAAGGDDAVSRLWLCSPDWRVAATWRQLSAVVHLVDSTRRRQVKEGVEKRASLLAAAGVDALNMHHTDWSAGLTTLVHRFGVHALAWDCQFERVVAKMLVAGVDGVYGDDVEQMMAAVTAWTR